MARTDSDKRLNLYRTVLKLSTSDECSSFFEDLCTEHELRIMAERLEILTLLRAGWTYRAIATELGVSTATVTRVAHALNYGTGGYKRIAPELGERVGAR